ncbi:MAG: hypothetical protein V1716_05880 [Candidatus Uhrbacteria bacterium]
MTPQCNIPDGESFIEEVDQWHEISYFIKNNLVYSYFADRKEQQYETNKGTTVEELLTDPSVKEWSKEWLRELVKKYSSNNT